MNETFKLHMYQNDTDHKIHILSPEEIKVIWRKWSNAIVCNKERKTSK